MRTIALCNQKGGVGKTATAVNLTAGLSLAEKNVLLIDVDPQANATSGIGIDYRQVEVSTYDCLLEPHRIREGIVKTEYSHLSVLPATPDLVGAEVELVNHEKREGKLLLALSHVNGDYDYGIVDCPPSLGLLTLNALVASTAVIIPVQCEYYALEGLEKLLRTLNRVKEALNPGLTIEGILLTMYDPRVNLSKDVVAEIRKHFPDVVFDTIIPRSVRVAEAPSYGKSVLHYSITSSGAQAYLQLIQEIIGRA